MTPNNSDQAAMHDDLRACPFCGGVAEFSVAHGGLTKARCEAAGTTACPVGPAVIGPSKQSAAFAWNRRAALTLPASEAVESVRWHPKRGFNWKSVGDGPCGDTGTGWIDVPLFITPQPSPAAHAGGEAVACVRREALNFVSDSFLFPPHMADAGDVLLYTHPSPMPVDALRSHSELCAMQAWLEEEAVHAESSWIDTLQERYEDGDDVPDSGHYVALWLAERLPDQLTALLSGGAAREGAK